MLNVYHTIIATLAISVSTKLGHATLFCHLFSKKWLGELVCYINYGKECTLQKCIAQSTIYAKYVATTKTTNEAIWLNQLVIEP